MPRFLLVTGFVYFLLIPDLLRAEPVGYEAITKPSADIEMSFARNGRIKEIAVEEGSIVEKGQVLARQENDLELIQLKMLTAKAEDTTKIQLARVEALQKSKDRAKFESAFAEGAVTDWELDHARLTEETANLQLKMVHFEHEQDMLKKTESEILLGRLNLICPVDGIVEEVRIETGESVEALQPVIRVVLIDPLLIDAPVANADTRHLRTKQKVDVHFPETGGLEPTVIGGHIKNISSVADAASNTSRVRIEVPNSLQRRAGERVKVYFAQ